MKTFSSLEPEPRAARPRAAREQSLQPDAIDLQLHRALADVDRDIGRPEHDLDAVVAVERFVLDQRLLVGLAAQELLRERRPAVGSVESLEMRAIEPSPLTRETT